uniref:Secreted protein n=1 Tax=Mycena chlorophos TaxID=658473 RepID=A0ABQ0LXP6_MYCCL|nr:predicted protein [Mycena chlorophos]
MPLSVIATVAVPLAATTFALALVLEIYKLATCLVPRDSRGIIELTLAFAALPYVPSSTFSEVSVCIRADRRRILAAASRSPRCSSAR